MSDARVTRSGGGVKSGVRDEGQGVGAMNREVQDSDMDRKLEDPDEEQVITQPGATFTSAVYLHPYPLAVQVPIAA